MTTDETPFEFFTVAYLTRIGNQSASTPAELLSGLEHCSDASIFHHTFQTLGRTEMRLNNTHRNLNHTWRRIYLDHILKTNEN